MCSLSVINHFRENSFILFFIIIYDTQRIRNKLFEKRGLQSVEECCALVWLPVAGLIMFIQVYVTLPCIFQVCNKSSSSNVRKINVCTQQLIIKFFILIFWTWWNTSYEAVKHIPRFFWSKSEWWRVLSRNFSSLRLATWL